MTAKCVECGTRFTAPWQPVSRGKASFTALAIVAIFVGIFAIQLVAIGASLPVTLSQELGAPSQSVR
jgi:hypothetical protein